MDNCKTCQNGTKTPGFGKLCMWVRIFLWVSALLEWSEFMVIQADEVKQG